jgi:hypothetical protein
MTNRLNALVVVLERDLREDDDAEALVAAIRQLRGVLDVTPHVATIDSLVAERRARIEVQARVYAALRELNS